MSVLYLEPMIYSPYDISLRKKDAIKLKNFFIWDGEKLPTVGFKPKRMPNKNFIYLEFENPLYMDVTSLEGTDSIISISTHYELKIQNELISVRHVRHLAFSKIGLNKTNGLNQFNQFNMRHSHPSVFGNEGHKAIKRKCFSSGLTGFRSLLKFGLDGADHQNTKWAIETVDYLIPNEQLLHGTLH